MAATGTPAYAVVDGTVSVATGMGCGGEWWGAPDQPPGWGYALYIDGDDGRSYRYLHLGVQDQPASVAYAEGITCGTRVSRGQHVGYVGHSGNASAAAPHLHLEIHDDAVSDPHGDPRINPYFSLRDAEERGDFGGSPAPVAYGEAEFPGTARVYGDERIATAAAVALEHWPEGAPTAVIATSRDYADAVTGSALAAVHDAPLLLSDSDSLGETTSAALQELGTTSVMLLGGEAALSADVAEALEAVGVEDVARLAGADRFETAARIAQEVGAPEGEVAVALGHPAGEVAAWPSGVAAGAFAALDEPVPTLLIRHDDVPEATADAVAALGVGQALLVAEDGAVAPDAVAQLAQAGVEVSRLGGADRYETSAAVLAELVARKPLAAAVAATGDDYPDALAGGALAARIDGALGLVPPHDLAAAPMMAERISDSGFEQAVVIGGPDAVADRVRAQLGEMMR